MSIPRSKTSHSIPQSTISATMKKSKSQAMWKALKSEPVMSRQKAREFYHSKLAPRFMQKVSGRAMERLGITNPKIKKDLHKLAIQGVGKTNAEFEKNTVPKIMKLIGTEQGNKFLHLMQVIGEENFKKIKDY